MAGIIDITEHRQSEQALVESEELFQLAFHSSPDAINLNRMTDGLYMDVNEGFCQIMGYSRDEVIGKTSLELNIWVNPEDRQRLVEGLVQNGIVNNLEAPFYRKGKIIGTGLMSARVLTYADEKVILSVMRDITERKRVEKAEYEQRILAEALRDTAAALNSTLDFDRILDHILANVGRVVPHDAANIMLIEEDAAYVVRRYGYNQRGIESQAASKRIALKECPQLNRVLQSGQGYIILDTQADAEWVTSPDDAWIRSHIAQAIRSSENVIGLTNLDSASSNAFTTRDAERLQAFADQAAVAIRNAQMYQKLAFYSEDLERAVIARTLELTEMNATLQSLSQAKDTFVSNVSHELKSPVTTLMLRHHLLRRHPDRLDEHWV